MFKAIIGNPDAMASEIASLWDTWKTAKNAREAEIAEVHQYLYATSTETTGNKDNGHNHTTHRPKLTQIYDNLLANYVSGLIPHDNFFRFDAEDDKSLDKDTKAKIEAYLRTKHRQMPNKFRGQVKTLVSDWLDGDCFAQVYYQNSTHTTSDGEVHQGYQGPVIRRIRMADIVFNPLAESFAASPKIIRTVKTLGSLARDIEESPEQAYQAEVFEKLVRDRQAAKEAKPKDVNQAVQLELDGFGSYDTYIRGNHVEILEFYGDIFDLDSGKLLKNYCITVVDRRYVARQAPVDTYNGLPMIFHARYRERKTSGYGMGALENLLGMQYYINHLENARADAFDEMLLPDRVIAGIVDETVDEKGSKLYYVDTSGDVKNLAPDATVLNADFKIEQTEKKMELYAGAPSEGIGVRTPGEKTKFEVGTLETNRSRFFQHNMQEFESAILEDIINAEAQLARKYLAQTKDTIRLDDETTGAKIFQEVSAADLQATGKLVPTGARHYAKQAQLAQNLLQFQQGVLSTDAELRQHFPSVRLAQIWEEFMEFESYGIMQPYGRIPEQMEAQRLMGAAQRQLEDEDAIDLEEGESEDVAEVPA
jgi:hypothetical protein